MKSALTLTALVFLASPVFAVGTDDSTKTPDCADGQVWNPDTELCETPKKDAHSDQLLHDNAQRYAYAGDYDAAQRILKAIKDQDNTRTLALWGFTHRKLGDVDLGLSFYKKALMADANNLEARAYLGEAYVEQGDFDAALHQLAEIKARGGTGSSAEKFLRNAILGNPGRKYQIDS